MFPKWKAIHLFRNLTVVNEIDFEFSERDNYLFLLFFFFKYYCVVMINLFYQIIERIVENILKTFKYENIHGNE